MTIERLALPPRRFGVFALGIEDEGRALIAQQMRDNQRHALAGARRRHNQHMLFGVQLEQLAVHMAEAHAARIVQAGDFFDRCEARALAYRRGRCGCVSLRSQKTKRTM